MHFTSIVRTYLVSEGVFTGLDDQDLVLSLVLVARATGWEMCHIC